MPWPVLHRGNLYSTIPLANLTTVLNGWAGLMEPHKCQGKGLFCLNLENFVVTESLETYNSNICLFTVIHMNFEGVIK